MRSDFSFEVVISTSHQRRLFSCPCKAIPRKTELYMYMLMKGFHPSVPETRGQEGALRKQGERGEGLLTVGVVDSGCDVEALLVIGEVVEVVGRHQGRHLYHSIHVHLRLMPSLSWGISFIIADHGTYMRHTRDMPFIRPSLQGITGHDLRSTAVEHRRNRTLHTLGCINRRSTT